MLSGKQIKKLFVNEDKSISQNIFLLPFIMILLQFCFLFVALFNSGIFIEWQTLTVGILLTAFWGGCFLYSLRQNSDLKLNKYNILLVIFYIFFCLVIIKETWFGRYLRIDAFKKFFEGKTFIDMLYHSVHAESIVTNGYPSMMMNDSTFHAYHCLSHYIIACFAKILRIPCLFVYNYIYPVVFIPLFLFMLQKVVLIGKAYCGNNKCLYFGDYLLLIACVYGFFPIRFQNNSGFFFYKSLINSESNFISIIFILLYFLIVGSGYNKNKKSDNINLFILIPLFILILSYTKVSAGVMFLLGVCYYVLRKYSWKERKFLLVFFYLGFFLLYSWIFRKVAITFPAPEIWGDNEYKLFHFVRTYCRKKSIFFPLFHYAFLFLPSILIVLFNKEKIFVRDFLFNKKAIFEEMSFLLMLAAVLPGILFVINGGSAFYFVFPSYYFSWLLFIIFEISSKTACFFIGIKQKDTIYKKPVISVVILVCVLSFCVKGVNIYDMAVNTLRSRQSLVGFRTDIPNNIKKLIGHIKTADNKNYLLLKQIKKQVSKRPKDGCIFIAENVDLINAFDNSYYIPLHPAYLARAYWAISGYLGMPIINSIYEDGDYFYRGDGRLYGTYEDFHGYSLPPPVCGKKITRANMEEYARAIGKKYIILIRNNSYSMVKIK